MIDAKKDILAFWFDQTQPAQWFQTNPDFDAQILARYEDAYDKAVLGIFDDWKNDPEGCLALCLLLDQFPRNMFRGTPKAFATDGKAVVAAKYALAKGFDQILPQMKRRFLYRPFEHSENLNDQRKSAELFEKMKKDDPLSYEYALRHLSLVEQFGRFPQRNQILGRMNSPEEEVYLAQFSSAF